MITDHRAPAAPAIAIGRYLLHREIARGGMATVHLARLIGDEGFSRIVAAKRLHPQLAEDHSFIAMFLAEARITSKLRHRNIVPVLDVVTSGGQVVLVQEYVHGAPLDWLLDHARLEGSRVPLEIAVSIACQVLSGLHAAHVLTDELGQPLDVVHRDVSPHNVMIATDGTARLLDFGVAKTSITEHPTQAGVYKGKIAYSAPEHLRGAAMPQSDVYSLAVVLWELLVGQRMYEPQSECELVVSVLNGARPNMRETLWKKAASIPSETWAQLEVLEPIVERGLALSIADRWSTAEELELALRAVITPAPTSAVAQWLKHHGKDYLELHERAISAEESSWRARPTRHAAGSTPPENSGLLRLLPPAATGAPRGSLNRLPAAEPFTLPPSLPVRPSPGVAVPRSPRLPEWRGHGAVIAVLGALILAALAGIVLVMRSSSQAAGAPSLLPASEPAQGVISRPGPRPPALPPQRDSAATRDTASRNTATRDLALRDSGLRDTASRNTATRDTATHDTATRDTATRDRARDTALRDSGLRDTATRDRAIRDSGLRDTATPNVRAAPEPSPPAREPAPRPRTEVASPAPRPRTEVASPAPARIVRQAPPRPAARPAARAPAVRAVPKPRPDAAPVPAKPEPRPEAEAVDCTPPYYYEGAKKLFKPACL